MKQNAKIAAFFAQLSDPNLTGLQLEALWAREFAGKSVTCLGHVKDVRVLDNHVPVDLYARTSTSSDYSGISFVIKAALTDRDAYLQFFRNQLVEIQGTLPATRIFDLGYVLQHGTIKSVEGADGRER